MSGVMKRLSHDGPNTYPVSEAVKGGKIIAPAADQVANKGKVRPAPAGSLLVLGVALVDAKPWVDPVSVDADGFDVVNANPLPTETTVEFGRFPVTYTADTAFGQALQAGANGTVTPIAADGDPRLVIGYCDEPGGVVVATNPVGLANISR
jgi:hypothetical protein